MEIDEKLYQFHKKKLFSHLLFVQQMLEKVRNTPYEKKWQQMYTCIISDKKRLTIAQTIKMDETLNDLRMKKNILDNGVNTTPSPNPSPSSSNQSPQPVISPIIQTPSVVGIQKPISIFCAQVPKLNNPPLSFDEIGNLLEENGGDDLSHINKEINEVKKSVEENKIKKAPEIDTRKVLQVDGVPRNRDPRLAGRSELNLNKPKILPLTGAQKAEAFYRRTMQKLGPQIITTPPLSGSTSDATKSIHPSTPLRTYGASKKEAPKPEIKIVRPDKKFKKPINEQVANSKKRTSSDFLNRSSNYKTLNSSNPLSSANLNFKIPKLNRSRSDLTKNEKPELQTPSSFEASQKLPPEKLQDSNEDLYKIRDTLKRKFKDKLNKKRPRQPHHNRKKVDSSDEDYQPELKKKIPLKTALKTENPKKLEISDKIEDSPTLNENVLKEFFSKLTNSQNCETGEKDKLLGILQNVVGDDLSNKIINAIKTKDEPSNSSLSTHDEDSCENNKKSLKLDNESAILAKTANDESELSKVEVKEETDLLKPLPVKKAKKNELDRLNEDILNMFIRDDVLTATGKRICSATKVNERYSSRERDLTPARVIKPSPNSSLTMLHSQKTQLDQKIARVVLVDLKLTEDDMPVDAWEYMKKTLIKQEPITSNVSGNFKATARKRSLQSKPLTRTRQNLIENVVEPEKDSEPEQNLQIDQKAVKNPVKAKRPLPRRRLAWNKGIIKKKRLTLNKISNVVKDLKEQPVKYVLKNTNSTIHTKNQEYISQCCLCDFSFNQVDTMHVEMVQHFVLEHGTHENFISRLSPEDAKNCKDNSMKITGPKIQGSKITFHCLFCLQDSEKCMLPEAWIAHIGLHTGEYYFKCKSCQVRVANVIEMKDVVHLPTCKQVFFVTQIDKKFVDRHLIGFMCDACNYVQIFEENLKKHVEKEHNGDDVKIIQISLCNYAETAMTLNHSLKVVEQDTIDKTSQIVEKMASTTSNTFSTIICEDDDGLTNSCDEWEDIDSDEKPSKTKQKATTILEMISKKSKKSKKNLTAKKSRNSRDISQKVESNLKKTEIFYEPPVSKKLDLKISHVQGHRVLNSNIVFKQCNRTGFGIENNEITYKCFISDCISNLMGYQFEKSQRAMFISHYEIEHKDDLWDGYCSICKIQITRSKLNLILDEIQHIESVHISNALAEDSKNTTEDYGKIRMKKLPGDNLSGNSDSTSPNIIGKMNLLETPVSTKSTEKQSIILQKAVLHSSLNQKKPVHISKSTITVKTDERNGSKYYVSPEGKMITIQPVPPSIPKALSATLTTSQVHMEKNVHVPESEDSVVYQHNLHPWIPNFKCRKSDEDRRRMLQYLTLYCTFKCMASKCSFYTSSPSIFFDHLQCHQRCHPEDAEYFRSCSYCSFHAEDLNEIIGHVLNEHRYNKFQCPHCFYRACAATHLIIHLDVYHKDRKKLILETLLPELTQNMAMMLVMNSINDNVPPIVCAFCKQKFFVTRNFLTHLNFHDDNIESKCSKCKERAPKQEIHKHLTRCHGFGLYQCVYCRFGTNSIDTIRFHLANLHFNHLPFACQRSPAFNPGPKNLKVTNDESVNSIKMMEVSLEVPAGIIQKNKFSSLDTINRENVMHMADTKLVRLITPQRIQPVQNTQIQVPQTIKPNNSLKNVVIPITAVSGQNVGKKIIVLPNDKRIIMNSMPPPKSLVGQPGAKPNLVLPKKQIIAMKNVNPTRIIKTISGQTLQISEVFSGSKVFPQNGRNLLSGTPTFSKTPSNIVKFQKAPATSANNLKPKSSIYSVQQLKVDAVVESMVKDSGVENSNLYRCGMVNCTSLCRGSMSFFQHLQTHNALTFPCFHCKKMLTNEVNTTNHYNEEHMLKRFFCYFCYHKECIRKKLSEHMSRVHKISTTNLWPLNPKKNNGFSDAFALCPESVTKEQFNKFLENLIQYDEHRKKTCLPKEKTFFAPNEMDLLPNTPIFGRALSCEVCSFSSKVRINLFRHLKQHTIDKENPKVSDMDDLIEYDGDLEAAITSADAQNLETTKLVPINERYKCNAKGCHYLSLDSEMFQSHLRTLHSKEENFACPHCELLICEGKMNVNQILAHLMLHGEKLFRCSHCSYYDSSAYSMKTHCKVHMDEEGINEVQIETIRNDRSSIREQRVIPAIHEISEPWKCEICNISAPSRNEVIQHMVSIHQFRTQFKCSHCSVRSNSIKYFDKHFELSHPDVYNLKVVSMFSKVSEPNPTENVASVSTQPLWVRDESKTKSIRGILFEDEPMNSSALMSSTIPSKTVSPVVAEIHDVTTSTGDFRFACRHCDKVFPDMQRLIKHWDIQHKNQIMVAQANELQNRPGKPFHFFLQKLHGQEGPVDFLTDAFFSRAFSATKCFLECAICHFKSCLALEMDAHFSSKHGMMKKISNPSIIVKSLVLKVSADAVLTFECHYRTKTTVCKYSTSSVKDFAIHWRDHVAFMLYGCSFCTRTADTIMHLMEHSKVHHPNEYVEYSNSNKKFSYKKLQVSHPDIQKILQENKIVLINGLVLSLKELERTAFNPIKVITKEIKAICAAELRRFLEQQSMKKLISLEDSDNEGILIIDEDPRSETTENPDNSASEIEDDLLQPMDESAISRINSSIVEYQDCDFSEVYIMLEDERITYSNFVKAYDSDPVVVLKQLEMSSHQLKSIDSESEMDESLPEEYISDEILNQERSVEIVPITTTLPIISAIHSSIELMDIDEHILS